MTGDYFEGYKIEQPFGRRSWGFIGYMVCYTSAFNRWKHNIGYVCESKDHLITFSIIYKDKTDALRFVQDLAQNPTKLAEMNELLLSAKKTFSE